MTTNEKSPSTSERQRAFFVRARGLYISPENGSYKLETLSMSRDQDGLLLLLGAALLGRGLLLALRRFLLSCHRHLPQRLLVRCVRVLVRSGERSPNPLSTTTPQRRAS